MSRIVFPARSPESPRTEDWHTKAVCRDAEPDDWFPYPTDLAGVQAAKEACFSCPVIMRCAQHALTRRIPDGVWGGLSEGQRNTLSKRHRAGEFEDITTVRAAVTATLREELDPESGLRDVWEARTYPLSDGHLGWRGDSGSFSYRGQTHTPKQLSFFLDRGRRPVKAARRTCPVPECVHPRHLEDQRERHRRKEREAAVALLAAVGVRAS